MTTDATVSFDSPSMIVYAGFHMVQAAANKLYEKSGADPRAIRMCELHDCFAQNELLSYEALGLCPDGAAVRFVDDGDTPMAARS